MNQQPTPAVPIIRVDPRTTEERLYAFSLAAKAQLIERRKEVEAQFLFSYELSHRLKLDAVRKHHEQQANTLAEVGNEIDDQLQAIDQVLADLEPKLPKRAEPEPEPEPVAASPAPTATPDAAPKDAPVEIAAPEPPPEPTNTTVIEAKDTDKDGKPKPAVFKKTTKENQPS